MLKLVLVVLVVFVLVLITEYLYRIKEYRTEFTRKFVHITVGTFAAFWPWIISWHQIEFLSLAFLFVVLISRLLTIFTSIHLIGRKTIGELFFAMSIGLVAILTHDRLIFMAALLHLSIADGLAAVIGKHARYNWHYQVFGQIKSVVGSLVFLVCSLSILIIYFTISHANHGFPILLWLPVTSTLLENIGLRGSDNILVPLVITLVLR